MGENSGDADNLNGIFARPSSRGWTGAKPLVSVGENAAGSEVFADFLFDAAASGINGTAAITLGALTSTATGALAISGTSTATLGALTVTGVGALTISGNAAVALDALTVTGTGTLAITGTSTATLDALTLAATGALAISGTAAVTLGELTLSATGAGDTPIVDGGGAGRLFEFARARMLARRRDDEEILFMRRVSQTP